MASKAIPDGYHTATVYLIVNGAVGAIEFYKQAFGAEELMRLVNPDGRIGHAEIKIGDSTIMLADEVPQMGFRSPQSFGGSPVILHLYVQDVDGAYARAIGAGGKALRPVTDEFYGDRTGMLSDPFGHVWTLATHVEDVSREEVERRFKQSMKP